MLKSLLFSFSMFTMFSLQAEIHHIDYGDGLVIGLNENYAMDINEDGETDFYINGYENELGFVPIPLIGCFTSPSGSAMNNLESREMQIHEEGDLIKIDPSNLFDYIDFDRGSLFVSGDDQVGTFANNWTNMAAQYIGFAVFVNTGEVINGWAKVMIDEDNETLVVLSIGYEDPVVEGQGGILAGDMGDAVGVDTVTALEGVNISPNPANDWVKLDFDYTGTQQLTIKVQDFSGKILYEATNVSTGKTNLTISVTDWAQGMYVVRFETRGGIKSQKLAVFR